MTWILIYNLIQEFRGLNGAPQALGLNNIFAEFKLCRAEYVDGGCNYVWRRQGRFKITREDEHVVGLAGRNGAAPVLHVLCRASAGEDGPTTCSAIVRC